jgi:hypothetical protein
MFVVVVISACLKIACTNRGSTAATDQIRCPRASEGMPPTKPHWLVGLFRVCTTGRNYNSTRHVRQVQRGVTVLTGENVVLLLAVDPHPMLIQNLLQQRYDRHRRFGRLRLGVINDSSPHRTPDVQALQIIVRPASRIRSELKGPSRHTHNAVEQAEMFTRMREKAGLKK